MIYSSIGQYTATQVLLIRRGISVTGDMKDILRVNLILQILSGDCGALDSLGGQASTVQINREGMDEGQQTEHRQSDVYLQICEQREEKAVRGESVIIEIYCR